jgi:glycosyltransferase involved in cell wall biosynthesis
MNYTCSIIIRAYNEEKHIGKLLRGIRSQSIEDVQIILVDSGSSDNTVSIAESFDAKILQIKPEQFTFGRSLNLGISKADAEIVVIASAHVYPIYPDWIEKMIEPFSDSKIALVYGRQSGDRTTKYSEKQVFKQWYPEHSIKYQDNPFCNNANSVIRKSLWTLHPFDENLPGLEDLEWAKWAINEGYKISYSAEAEIVHVHNETWKGIKNRYQREGMAFKQINPQANFSFVEFLSLFLGNTFSDWSSARKENSLWVNIIPIIKFRFSQFWGTYQGYRHSGPLTLQLKKTFYYPRNNSRNLDLVERKDIKPISYDDF